MQTFHRTWLSSCISLIFCMLLLNLCVCVQNVCPVQSAGCMESAPHECLCRCAQSNTNRHNPGPSHSFYVFRKSRDYRIMRSGCTQVYGIVSRILLVCYSKCHCHATNLFLIGHDWIELPESHDSIVQGKRESERTRGRKCVCMWVKWKRGGIMHISTI